MRILRWILWWIFQWIFGKFNWNPPNNSAMGFLEHVYREDNCGADRLATEGRNNGGESLVCTWFDPNIRYMVCQWDGGFDAKTPRGGGGFIVSRTKTHNEEFKPMIEWSCGFHDVKDAVTAEMWNFLAMTVLIKNMASSWKTFGLDSLIRVVKSDSNFE